MHECPLVAHCKFNCLYSDPPSVVGSTLDPTPNDLGTLTSLFPYKRQGCSAQWISQARADPHRGEALKHMTVSFLKFVIMYNKKKPAEDFF
jgi:hypothetical protein